VESLVANCRAINPARRSGANAALLIIAYVPAISLWLPSLLKL
jgi:hypothetical protein